MSGSVVYSWTGEPMQIDRDIVGEICDEHGLDEIDKALRKSGYRHIVSVGVPSVAQIDLYMLGNTDSEYRGIALVELGQDIQTYVFEQYHSALVFLKEFTPMIDAVNTMNIAED